MGDLKGASSTTSGEGPASISTGRDDPLFGVLTWLIEKAGIHRCTHDVKKLADQWVAVKKFADSVTLEGSMNFGDLLIRGERQLLGAAYQKAFKAIAAKTNPDRETVALDGDFLFIADSEWDQKILTKTFASVGKITPDNWRFQKTPDNFTNGTQRNLFNDEMAVFFLRYPDEKQHHALADARAIRNAYPIGRCCSVRHSVAEYAKLAFDIDTPQWHDSKKMRTGGVACKRGWFGHSPGQAECLAGCLYSPPFLQVR